jgi:hypothetical protein
MVIFDTGPGWKSVISSGTAILCLDRVATATAVFRLSGDTDGFISLALSGGAI